MRNAVAKNLKRMPIMEGMVAQAQSQRKVFTKRMQKKVWRNLTLAQKQEQLRIVRAHRRPETHPQRKAA